jgi:hypothetical protein
VKKLLNMAQTWHYSKETERSDSSGMRAGLVHLGADGRFPLANRSTPTSTKNFWHSMWSPGSVGHILTEITSFGGFSSGPHHHGHLAVLGRILDSGRLAVIFTRLEFAGLLYAECLQVKVQAKPHTNLAALHQSIPAEWHQLAVEYIHKTCLEAVLAKKWCLHWVDGQPTAKHTPISTFQS